MMKLGSGGLRTLNLLTGNNLPSTDTVRRQNKKRFPLAMGLNSTQLRDVFRRYNKLLKGRLRIVVLSEDGTNILKALEVKYERQSSGEVFLILYGPDDGVNCRFTTMEELKRLLDTKPEDLAKVLHIWIITSPFYKDVPPMVLAFIGKSMKSLLYPVLTSF